MQDAGQRLDPLIGYGLKGLAIVLVSQLPRQTLLPVNVLVELVTACALFAGLGSVVGFLKDRGADKRRYDHPAHHQVIPQRHRLPLRYWVIGYALFPLAAAVAIYVIIARTVGTL